MLTKNFVNDAKTLEGYVISCIRENQGGLRMKYESGKVGVIEMEGPTL